MLAGLADVTVRELDAALRAGERFRLEKEGCTIERLWSASLHRNQDPREPVLVAVPEYARRIAAIVFGGAP